MHTYIALLPATVLLVASVGAQKTWVVDAAGATGSDFKTLPAAITKASPGDRLLVRAGTYDPFALSKGLTIIGEPGAKVVVSKVTETNFVRDVAASQTATVRGVTFSYDKIGAALLAPLMVIRCKGRVILEDLVFQGTVAGNSLDIQSCAAVTMEGCTTDRRLSVTKSHFVGVDSKIGAANLSGIPVVLRDSRVRLVACAATGGFGLRNASLQAIDAGNTQLELRGVSGYFASNGNQPTHALIGDSASTLVYDSAVVRLSAPKAHNGFGRVSNRRMGWLLTRGSKIGGQIEVQTGAAALSAWFLYLGLPMRPAPLGGWGDLWIDPQLYWRVAQGVHGKTGATTLKRTVPNSKAFLGLAVTYQALTGTASALEFTNPSTVVLAQK